MHERRSNVSKPSRAAQRAQRMFMPSARIYEEMQIERAGFWPVPINKGDEYAFLIKAPTHVVKAAYRSAPTELLVAWTAAGEVGNVMATAISIADDPKSPFGISGVHRHKEEQAALQQILLLKETLLVFFDELSRPVARAKCKLASESCDVILAEWRTIQDWYVGLWKSPLPEVLDEVDAIVDPTKSVQHKYLPTAKKIDLQLTEFQTCKISMIGTNEVCDFNLDCQNEGYGLEQSTWQLIENIFEPNIFHSPQVYENSSKRELIDILSYCERGLCLTEAKAVAVLSTSMDRSTERRGKNILKQIKKALDQLPGAMQNIAAKMKIESKDGKTINLPTFDEMARVGIIMVSELLPCLDWSAVAEKVISSAKESKASFVVLDLHELRLLIGISTTANELLEHLVRRYEIMVENGTALIQTQFARSPAS